MQTITKTRKERIMKEKAMKMQSRRRKVIGCALAGTVATSSMFNILTEKASASSQKTYIVQNGDTLSKLAQKNGVSVEQILQANNLSSDFIRVGQKLGIPSQEKKAHLASLTKTEIDTNQVYTVVAGDTLSEIALQFHVKVKQIQQANGLSSDFLQVGQNLEIPSVDKTEKTLKKQSLNETNKKQNQVYTVKSGDNLSLIAEKYGVTIQQIQKVNGLTTDRIYVGQQLKITGEKIPTVKKMTLKNPSEKVAYATYTVAPGDSIWSIGKQFNLSIEKIKSYNQLSSNAVIIGQKLIIKQHHLVKTTAIVNGVVDNFSIEFIINGEPTVLQVAYGTASNYASLIGQPVELVYYDANRPTLVSCESNH